MRAEFWLDDNRLVPEAWDRAQKQGATEALARVGLFQVNDPEHLLRRVRAFVQKHRAEFLAACPDLSSDERRFLGLVEYEQGAQGPQALGQQAASGQVGEG